MAAHASHVAVLLALGFVAVSSAPALAQLRGRALSAPGTKPKQPQRNWNPMCLGIIGGVGPQASADVVTKIVTAASEAPWYYQARDTPAIYLQSSPKLDGVTQNNWVWATPEEQTANIGDLLAEIADGFPPCVREYGAFGLACNTIHAYVLKKFNNSDAFVSIINAVDEAIELQGTPKGGNAFILGSGVTMDGKLSEYEALWNKYNVNPGIPEDKLGWLWDNVILKVQKNEKELAHTNFKHFLELYVTSSSVPVALTCTELPIAALTADNTFIPGYNFIDPNKELAKAVLERGQKRLSALQPELEMGWKSGIKRFEGECCSKTHPEALNDGSERKCDRCCEGNVC